MNFRKKFLNFFTITYVQTKNVMTWGWRWWNFEISDSIRVNLLNFGVNFKLFLSYVAGPDGSRSPGLSRTKEGLLVTEVDLNQLRQVRDSWMFRMTSRLEIYRDLLNKATSPGFKPQIIKEE